MKKEAGRGSPDLLRGSTAHSEKQRAKVDAGQIYSIKAAGLDSDKVEDFHVRPTSHAITFS